MINVDKHRYHWKLPTEGVLSTHDINIARACVLAGGGKALRTLAVGTFRYNEEKDGVDIVDDFVKNCPSVTSLSVEDMGRAWVSRFGNQLQKLELATENTRGLSQYCSSLRELNLWLFPGKTNINAADKEDRDLWKYVGVKLEKLTFKSADPITLAQLENVEKYCRKLRHIDAFGYADIS